MLRRGRHVRKTASKGQVTIPKAIRDQLNLEPGVMLRLRVDPSGRIVITPLTLGIEDLIGILPRPDKPLTVEEINETIARAAVERATRPFGVTNGFLGCTATTFDRRAAELDEFELIPA